MSLQRLLRFIEEREMLLQNKGGPGSGDHGHAGRPGKRGGSAGGAKRRRSKRRRKKKMTISQAARALSMMGYKLGPGNYDLKTKKTSYELTKPNNEVVTMEAGDIADMALEMEG